MTKKLLFSLALAIVTLGTFAQNAFANYYYGRYNNGAYSRAYNNNCGEVNSCETCPQVQTDCCGRGWGRGGRWGYGTRWGYNRANRRGIFFWRRGYDNRCCRRSLVGRTVRAAGDVTYATVDTAADVVDTVSPL